MSLTTMSIEEWFALDEDDSRELVDGVLEEPEVPNFIHETVVTWLVLLLHSYFHTRGGLVVGSGVKLAIASDRGRLADVVCYAPKRRPEMLTVVRTPPDIVVEVISRQARDKTRDRVDKVADYAAFGIKQYWLVDPKERTFEILVLGQRRRYKRAVRFERGKMGVPGFAGLVVNVDALWLEIDRLMR